jgi:hypothetical protein
MRSWIVFITTSAFAAAAAMGGCSGNDATSSNISSTISVGSGANDPNLGCENRAPNGECNIRSATPESCECPDCVEAAACRGTCNDDGACSFNPGAETNDEDCTCDDCYGKHGACPPFGGQCNFDEPGCQSGEACTCPDCAGAAHCGCDNNGQCTEATEGCACADCDGVAENCGGNPTTTTTQSSGGGMGGSGMGGMGAGAGGGAGGAGGAGGM